MNTATTDATVEPTVAPRPARARLWPLWGAVSGLLGFVATVVLDTRPMSEILAIAAGEDYTVSADDVASLERMTNYVGFLVGFAAVAAMVVFAASWKRWVEHRYPESIAAKVVSGGLYVSAAGLALAYGWKGALANYGYGGNEFGMFDDSGLYVYYVLTDFGPYIPWLGVLVAAAAFGWLAWKERLLSRVLGTVSALYAAGVAGMMVLLAVPGLPGPFGGLWLALASLWIAFGRSRITLKDAA
ncbi:hypothetical protein M2152_000166 [Microbacteriaceae bacterium SG_E_30_P1]|uniref:DUF4386 family protein n=1 Tax=Antiquaquibacter oligotrophicus TaxID=2880260 RepID=A0ABT6KJ50_9MICO|nr:hypothetical protein [Antiquaquibacter oligotrophicus]MDH6179984.1 hypothetical protein [Antiquaquibacter oligotrophicus]UDF14260.1 hypothetical protein LH407_05200 [Antiquaquibacter oligotrophicus]